jgi:hypothetical protein
MIRRSKSAREHWPLHRSDLAQRWLAAREPRLADLENNPIFRLLRFQVHRQWRGWSPWLAPAWLLIVAAVAFFILRSGGGRNMFPFVIWGIILFNFGRHRNKSKNEILAIPKVFIGDMAQAAVNPDLFVRGLWGAAAAPINLVNYAIFIAIGLSASFYVGFSDGMANGLGVVGVILALFTGVWISALLFWPHSAMAGVLRNIRMARRMLEAQANPWRELVRRIGEILRVLLIAIPIVALIVVLIIGGVKLVDRLPFDPRIILNHRVALVACFLVGFAMGAGFAWDSRRRVERYFNSATKDIEAILELLARAEPGR